MTRIVTCYKGSTELPRTFYISFLNYIFCVDSDSIKILAPLSRRDGKFSFSLLLVNCLFSVFVYRGLSEENNYCRGHISGPGTLL